jgi:cyclophilin family peptidyl-prolyl cis-trans isomerase
MIRLGLLLGAVASVALVFAPASAAGPPSQRFLTIVKLESERSLGNGELASLLATGDERVAARAALAIGRTKLSAGEAALAAHLHDRRNAVRAVSVYALGLLATGGHGAAIVAALGDPSGAVRVAAVDAVARYEAAGRFGTAESTAQSALERTLAADADALVRARAATASIEFRNGAHAAEAADALSTAFRTDSDANVRWHAMWAIYRAYAASVNRKLVESALHDGNELVRIEAVRAMSRYKDAALVSVVRPLLRDPSWRVQEQAAETIRVLQGKPMSAHWTAIPKYVHLPKGEADPYASLAAYPRPKPAGKPSAPRPRDAIFQPQLDPSTAALMTSPARGPHPRLRIVTTKGNLYVVLYPEWAPLTVENFMNLAQRGYYDRNRWFRIVPDFVVQTGDPNDNGEGDAGYSLVAEENPLEQRSYVISMGLNYDDKTQTPIRDSAGTQYYVTLSPQLHLDRDFTVFGAMTAGFDVLPRLVESDRVLRVERVPDAML